MQDQTKQIYDERDRRLERAVVSQTLRDDRTEGWSHTDLAAEFTDADPREIRDALARLHEAGVVELTGETVRASPATVHLNALAMIAI